MIRAFKARSIRGLFAVMPSRDLRFTGLTFGWVGVGFIRTVPNAEWPTPEEEAMGDHPDAQEWPDADE